MRTVAPSALPATSSPEPITALTPTPSPLVATATASAALTTTPTPIAIPTVTPTPTHPGYIYFKKEYDQIWRYDLANDQERLLVNRKLFYWMSISSDGDWLTYRILDIPSKAYSPGSIGVLNTRTGEERQVTQRVAFSGASWLPNGQLLVIEWPEFHISADRKSIAEGPGYATQIDLRTGVRTAMNWPPLEVPEDADAGTGHLTHDFDCAARWTRLTKAPYRLEVLCKNDNQPHIITELDSYGAMTWSPDGQTLAFHGSTLPGQTATEGIYLWRRSSQTLHAVAGTNRDGFALTWSPDGKWLAFQGEHDLCFLDVVKEQVTCHAGYLSGIGVGFSWSFNSQYVVIKTCASELCAEVGCDCNERALVTVHAPDGQPRKLHTTKVDPTFPDPVWGR